MSEIMTPEHPRWKEFVEKLEGPEGCNLEGHDDGTGTCDSKIDRPITRRILGEMGDVDIEASLLYFFERGGYCDCQVVYHVIRKFQ